MQVSLSRDALLTALAPGAAVTTKNDSSTPTLAYVLIEARAGTVIITGTNLLCTMTRSSPCNLDRPGEICAPAREMESIVRLMPAGDVRLSVGDNSTVTIESLAKGKKIAVTLRGLHASSYPQLDKVKDEAFPPVTVKIADLRMLADAVIYAASRDTHRPHLGVVHIEGEGVAVHFVTTDGHRLAHATAAVPFPATGLAGIGVPARSMQRLLDALPEEGDVDLRLAPGFLVACSGPMRAVLKLQADPFPTWRTIIPASFTHTCTLARNDAQTLLARAAPLSGGKRSTSFAFSGKNGAGELVISVDNPDQGAMRDSVDEGVSMSGDAIKTAMNADYIEEALQHLPGDKITFSMRGEREVAHLSGSGYVLDNGFKALALVMPMSI